MNAEEISVEHARLLRFGMLERLGRERLGKSFRLETLCTFSTCNCFSKALRRYGQEPWHADV
jgi:hypothetical protein